MSELGIAARGRERSVLDEVTRLVSALESLERVAEFIPAQDYRVLLEAVTAQIQVELGEFAGG